MVHWRFKFACLIIGLLAVLLVPVASAQNFRPDPGRRIGQPRLTAAGSLDIFADIRRMETEALALQKEILQLNGEILQCMDQELDRIARDEAARQQIQRDGRNIVQRAIDFLFRRNRPPQIGQGGPPVRGAGAGRGGFRDPESVLSVSCLNSLAAQAETKRTQLRNLETRIAAAFTNLYNTNRTNAGQTASIALHQFASCVRQEAFPTHTKIPDLQTDSSCNGGIVEDQLLFTYADQLQPSQLPASIETMGRYSNQLQCQSEIQAVLFNYALGKCLERIAIPDDAKCDYDTALFHPVLNAADAILYTNPKTFRWVEDHRRDLIQCLPSSKLAATGYWCHDLKSGQMKQWRLCQQGAGTSSPACELGSDFIWSLKGRNMGSGDCTMCELLAKGPVEGKGYLCDGKVCGGIAEAEGRDGEEVSDETPFRSMIAEVQQQICNQRDARAPAMIPQGCGVNLLPGYRPRSGESAFNCREAGASGPYLGARDTPGCIAGEGGGEITPVDEVDGEPVYEVVVRAQSPTNERSQSQADHGPRDREPPNVSQETYNQIRESTARFMEHPDSPWRRITDQAVTSLGYAHPTEEAFRQAIRATRGALYRPNQSGYCRDGALACAGMIGDEEFVEFYEEGNYMEWPESDGYAFGISVIKCHVGGDLDCGENFLHEAIHLVFEYMRLERAREIVMAATGQDPLTHDGGLIWDDLWEEHNLMFNRDNPSSVMSGMPWQPWSDPEHRAMTRGHPGPIPPWSCGEEDCSGTCTPGVEKLTRVMECIRSHAAPAPRGCPSGQDPSTGMCIDEGGYLPARVNLSCVDQGLISNSPSNCWAVDCPPEQFAIAMGGTCSCRTPGAGGGGPVGPLDCNNDYGPRDPRCPPGSGRGEPRGLGGSGGGAAPGSGLPGSGFPINIPGGGPGGPAEGR